MYIVYPLTEKPQNIHPGNPNKNIITKKNQEKPDYVASLNPVDIAFSNEKFKETFKLHRMQPKEKYSRPQTANQEIGWYNRPLLDNRKWDRPISSTFITKYVSDYDKLKHINPFKLPVSRLPMK